MSEQRASRALYLLHLTTKWAIRQGKRVPEDVLDLHDALERYERRHGDLPVRWFLSAIQVGVLADFFEMEPRGRLVLGGVVVYMRAPPWIAVVARAEQVGKELHKRGEVRGP